MKTGMVEVVVYETTYFDFYGSFDDLARVIEGVKRKVPKELIRSARVDLEPCDNYGDSGVAIKVTYERSENPADQILRMKEEDLEHKRKLKKYHELKKELGL